MVRKLDVRPRCRHPSLHRGPALRSSCLDFLAFHHALLRVKRLRTVSPNPRGVRHLLVLMGGGKRRFTRTFIL